MLIEHTKKKILERPDYIGIYQKAINWIKENTIEEEGINNTLFRKKLSRSNRLLYSHTYKMGIQKKRQYNMQNGFV